MAVTAKGKVLCALASNPNDAAPTVRTLSCPGRIQAIHHQQQLHR
jgi:hypothetical protein